LNAWQAEKSWFWPRFCRPAEAIRGLADPALAWSSQKGFRDKEYVATIETAAQFVTQLAMLTVPCSSPEIYANKADAWREWERQGQLLLAAETAWRALRRLAGLTGDAWHEDRADRDQRGASQAKGAGAAYDQGGAGQAERDSETDGEELTERQCLILETMLEHAIDSYRRRISRAFIVPLINRNHKPASYGRDFAALVKRGFLQTQEGPGGGYWLTLSGKAEVQRPRDSNQ
jgi:hypothetical protein